MAAVRTLSKVDFDFAAREGGSSVGSSRQPFAYMA